MLDRKRAPQINEIQKIDFIRPEKIPLNPAVNLLWMPNVLNETSRIDLYFDAGLRKDRNVVVSLCSSLLLSGTSGKSSTKIHEELDELGAYFDIGLSHDGMMISIYALRSAIYRAFQLMFSAIQEVTFPENEIAEMINEKREKLKVNLSRVGFIAQREFQRKIYAGSPYNELTSLDDFDRVSREEIVQFHANHLRNGLYRVAVTGRLSEKEIASIKEQCSSACVSKKPKYRSDFSNTPGKFHIDHAEALQSAIRIGKIMFNKRHKDFIDFSILNTVFGDYFGCRLMKNIREDKGYTYGIGSTLVETGGAGYFIIGSEVGVRHREKALEEIEKEMKILSQKPILKTELSLVKNYLLGQVLKMADGPYAMMDLYLSVDTYGLSMDFYNSYIDRIHQIESEELNSIAKTYLSWDSMSIVTSG